MYSCILLFWALSLVASPLALLYLQDEVVVLSLNSSGEEEPGEPGSFDTLQEKMFFSCQEPLAAFMSFDRSESPQSPPWAHHNHVCEILLPPPEGKQI